MRRLDTGWRDNRLTRRHQMHGFAMPVAGMALPMIEYDRGKPVALINYLRRDWPLPTGPSVGGAYRALGSLYGADGHPLPFLTARYDPADWAFQVLGHNEAAHEFLDTDGWTAMTERQFVANLYHLRNRVAPDLAAYGVDFADTDWASRTVSDGPAEAWPGASMSVRRRNYEPVPRVRPTWLNPCLDIDLAVIDRADRVALVVDYKSAGAHIGLDSTNVKALASLQGSYGRGPGSVPAMVVRYEPDETEWRFAVHPANVAARNFLAYALGATSAPVGPFAGTIAGNEWVDLRESQWIEVLRTARDL